MLGMECNCSFISNASFLQADSWSNSRGLMLQNIVTASCEIIKSGFMTDRSAVESFLLSLAANVRDCNDLVIIYDLSPIYV